MLQSLAAKAGVAIVLLASVALGCGGTGEPPTTSAVPDSADQVLFGMRTTLTVDGVLRVTVEADTAFLYQGPQTAELHQVRVQFHSPQGAISSTVTALEGTYDWRREHMEARRDVVAFTPDNRRLTTSILRYSRRTDRISGPEPFVFDAPDRHLEGDGFTADPEFENVTATRPRRGTVGEPQQRRE